MTSGRRIGRWVLIGVGGLAALALFLRIGGGLYLNSAGGRAVVAEELGSMIGLPVEVADLDVGSRTSSIKFRVLDPALQNSPNAEVLSVESAEADVSFAELVTGRARPSELRLRGVSVALRVDASGKILTTLPAQPANTTGEGKVPRITLENGRVAVRQEGRPEFVLTGVSLRAEPSGDKVVMGGSVDDPGWGKWKVSGEVDKASRTGWLDLATEDAPLDLERLKSIPYVPPAVWENAHPAGRGKAVIRFAVGPEKELKYDVRVQPKGAILGVPAAEVTLTDVAGILRVHDGLVEISGAEEKTRATGKLAGGTVTVGAKWDYAKEPAVADPVIVTADRLAVKDLPAKWGLKTLGGNLPGKLSFENGFLTGDAKLKLLVHENGRVETYGGGSGKIVVPAFAGGSVEIGVTLGGDGQKLEFGRAPTPPPPAKEPDPEPKSERVPKGDAVRGEPGALATGWFGRTPSASEGVFQPTPSLALGVRQATPRSLNTLRVTVTTERELFALVTFLALQPKADPKAEPRTDQTNLDATIALRDIDIGQLVQQLELKVPYKVSGKVTVQAKLAVPLGEAATAASYRLTGTLTSPELTFEGLTVRGLTTEVVYQNGKLSLNTLRATFPQPNDPAAKPGELSGSASASLDPVGDVTASLTLDRIPLGPLASAIPGLGITAGGLVSGKAEFKAPFEKIADPGTWDASATLRSDSLSIAGRNAKAVAFTAVVAKGTLTLKEGAATIEGIPLTAYGTLGLTGKYPFDAAVKTTGTGIADLRRLVPELELPVPVEGVLETESKVVGTLAPVSFTASGRVQASKLTLNKTAANQLDVKWEVIEDRLRLTDLNAAIFGGTVTGSVDYPFHPEKAGAFNVSFKDVDLAAAWAFVPDFPLKLTGAVTGKVVGTIPAAKDGQGRVGNLDLDLTAPKLTVPVPGLPKGLPAERLVGKLAVKNGVVDFSLTARVTDSGTIDLKVPRYVLPWAKEKAPAAEPKEGGKNRGSLRVTNFNLAALADSLGGLVDVAFDFAPDLSEGSGRVFVRGLSWGDEEASPEIFGLLLLRDGVLELRDLNGSLAGGLLRGRGRVFLDNPRRNFVSLSLDRADAGRLLAPIPGLAGVIGGQVSVVVRGTLGREMRGSGTVTLARGNVGGADLTELRIPFDYATAANGSGRLTVREASTRAGSGRASGGITVDWGAGVRVSGQVRFIDVPLRALAPGLGENALVGNGRITGRFDLSGSNVRSADDLTGTLVAALNNTSVKEVPLLRQAVPYLNPIGATKPFQSGDVRATLSRGAFRVQRLALANPTSQLFAEGTITTAGRLDLDVVAHTGQIGPDIRGLRLLGLRIPAFGPVPLTLIRDVSTFVSNRMVRLTITGTVANPVVRVNTGALLTEEAVRFFLTRYVVPTQVTEVLGVGTASGIVGGTSGNGGGMPRR